MTVYTSDPSVCMAVSTDHHSPSALCQDIRALSLVAAPVVCAYCIIVTHDVPEYACMICRGAGSASITSWRHAQGVVADGCALGDDLCTWMCGLTALIVADARLGKV